MLLVLLTKEIMQFFSDEILHEYKVIVSYIIKIHLMHKTTIIIMLVRHLKNPFPFHLQDDLYL